MFEMLFPVFMYFIDSILSVIYLCIVLCFSVVRISAFDKQKVCKKRLSVTDT